MRDYAQAFDGFSHDDAVARQLRGSLAAMNACVECCDTATRAHAVSSRLTALSGSWRAGT